MDLVVIGEWDTLPLHSLAQALLKNGVCNDNIQVLDKASVNSYIFIFCNYSPSICFSFKLMKIQLCL